VFDYQSNDKTWNASRRMDMIDELARGMGELVLTGLFINSAVKLRPLGRRYKAQIAEHF